MTLTKELRNGLEELGVEYTTVDGKYVKETCWVYMGELTATFIEYDDGTTHFQCDQRCFTPAQAIAVTVGEGTCHMRLAYEEEDADGCIWPDHYECDACGAKVNGIMPYCDTEIPPKFCPNCGRKTMGKGRDES